MAQALATAFAAALAGIMAFFAGVVAPAVFRTLDQAAAGGYLRAVFPAYYLAVGILALVAASGYLAAGLTVQAAVLAAIATGFAIARWILVPRIDAVRDAARAGEAVAARTFARLHRASVALNALQFITVLVVVAERVGSQ